MAIMDIQPNSFAWAIVRRGTAARERQHLLAAEQQKVSYMSAVLQQETLFA